MSDKKRVLFLCTGNSARSQMAEAWLRHLAGDCFEVYSAGTEAKERVHPLAVAVMTDAGIDISQAKPKPVRAFVGEPWDFIITVCDRAKETCPVFPHEHEQIHWSIPDPAAVEGTEIRKRVAFEDVSKAIKQRLDLFVTVQTRRRV